MTFYIEKVKRKKGTRYRIVKDYTYQGERRREYFSLPSGTTKTQAEMIRMQMALEAGYGNYITKPPTLFKDYTEHVYFANGTVFNILLSARKLYLKEQSENSGFNGQNHVFILHKAPFIPVTAKKIYKIYVSFLKKECPELPQYRLHDLRHTYFTWCSEIEGFSELSMIGTGGHSNIQSSRRYQHATMERMRSDMGKLETAFLNAKSTG